MFFQLLFFLFFAGIRAASRFQYYIPTAFMPNDTDYVNQAVFDDFQGADVSLATSGQRVSQFMSSYKSGFVSMPAVILWIKSVADLQNNTGQISSFQMDVTSVTLTDFAFSATVNYNTQIQLLHIGWLASASPKCRLILIESAQSSPFIFQNIGPYTKVPDYAYFINGLEYITTSEAQLQITQNMINLTVDPKQTDWCKMRIVILIVDSTQFAYNSSSKGTVLINFQTANLYVPSGGTSQTFRMIIPNNYYNDFTLVTLPMFGFLSYRSESSPYPNLDVKMTMSCTVYPYCDLTIGALGTNSYSAVVGGAILVQYTCQNADVSTQKGMANPLCICYDQYYNLNSGLAGWCRSCPEAQIGCLRCSYDTNIFQCLFCEPTSFRRLVAGVCACQAGYYDDGSITCLPCIFPCKNCSDNTTCLSCQIGSLNADNSCSCNPGTYFDQTTNLCQPCSYQCSQCSSYYKCTNCTTSNGVQRILNSTTGICNCPQGYYDNTISYTCQACQINCLTCINSQTCTGCKPNRSLDPQTLCQCKQRYYENQDETCGSCLRGCLQCSDSNSCLQCAAQDIRNVSSPNCDCLPGYYDNQQIYTCQACPHSCLECTSYDTCTKCPLTRTLNNGTCACNVSYFDIGDAVCEPCFYNCYTCSNKFTCDTCSDTRDFRLMDNATNTCKCQPGYVENLPVSVCAKCPYYCFQCNASGCLSCGADSFRSINTKALTCPCNIRYYDDGTPDCKPCLRGCYACSQNNTCSLCLPSDNRQLVNQTCQCKDGYFDDGISNQCQQCDNQCKTCFGSRSSCTSCSQISKRIFNSTAESCTCPPGLIDIGKPICSPCFYSCLTCFDLVHCATCNPNQMRIMNDQTKQCSCKSGYFDDGLSPQCGKCDFKCQECQWNAFRCTQCSQVSLRIFSEKSYQCFCGARYFDSGSPICQPCHYTCYYCSNNISCDTCNQTDYRVANKLTNLCVCQDGYFDTGVSVCSSCNKNCLKCTNATYCLNCVPNLNRALMNNLCECADRYFEKGLLACVACHYSCLTCTNSTFCSSCYNYDFRTLINGKCVCMDGYFDDGQSSVCQKCDQTCLTCYAKKSCLTCSNLTQRSYNQVQQSCLCQPRYYEGGGAVCKACDRTCYQCSPTDSGMCLACAITDFRILKIASCICMDGYYDDRTVSICSSCSHTCLTCLNSTSCISCPQDAGRNYTDGQCPCDPRYFDDGTQICKSCYYQCYLCQNSSGCSACSSDDNRKLDLISLQCICMDGYFDDGSTPQCGACNYTCYQCSDSLNCISCPPKSYRTLDSVNNKCPCDPRYFDDGVLQCAPCLFSCWRCSNRVSCDMCNKDDFRTLDASTKLCYCNQGYYDDGFNSQCQLISKSKISLKCDAQCHMCITAQVCVNCDTNSNRYFDASVSRCPCIQGFYDPGEKNCLPCKMECLTCISPSRCQSCDKNKFRQLSATSGRCPCIDGYYDPGSPLCLACRPGCATCRNSTYCFSCVDGSRRIFNQSLFICKCIDGYYDSNQVNCQKCHYSCLTCSSQNDCSSCDKNQTRWFNPLLKQCLCLDGYYDNQSNQSCSPCDSKCLTCWNETTCITCNSTQLRRYSADVGFCVCQDRYFNTGDDICQPCDHSCLTCQSLDNCDSCSQSDLRSYDNGVCICKPGYFDNGINQKCQPCHITCMECSNYTRCTACDSLKYRILINNTCQCRIGYQDSKNSPDGQKYLCFTCQYTCATCSNLNDCLTCADSDYRVMNAKQQCGCVAGYYDDGLNRVCQKCGSKCSQCIKQDFCTECYQSQIRYIVAEQYLCKCEDGYFENQGRDVCESCDLSCLTCIGASNNCVTCKQNGYLRVATCYCEKGYIMNPITKDCDIICKIGTFLEQQSRTCLSCPPQCYACITYETCSMCDQALFRELVGTQCSCQQGYFDYKGQTLCQRCHYSCQTCVDGSPQGCTSCQVNLYRDFINNQCVCRQGFFEIYGQPHCQYQCQIGQYYEKTLGLCQQCHPVCYTCNGPNYGDCVTCFPQPGVNISFNSTLQGPYYMDDLININAFIVSYRCRGGKINAQFHQKIEVVWEIYENSTNKTIIKLNQTTNSQPNISINPKQQKLDHDVLYMAQLSYLYQNTTYRIQSGFKIQYRQLFTIIRGGNQSWDYLNTIKVQALVFDFKKSVRPYQNISLISDSFKISSQWLCIDQLHNRPCIDINQTQLNFSVFDNKTQFQFNRASLFPGQIMNLTYILRIDEKQYLNASAYFIIQNIRQPVFEMLVDPYLLDSPINIYKPIGIQFQTNYKRIVGQSFRVDFVYQGKSRASQTSQNRFMNFTIGDRFSDFRNETSAYLVSYFRHPDFDQISRRSVKLNIDQSKFKR